MTPPRETLHECLLREVWRYLHHRDDEGFQCAIHRDGPDTCDCGAQRAFNALRAENARLAASAAIVEAMDRGELDTIACARMPMGQPQGVLVFRADGKGFSGETTLAAYAKATATEGTDA